MNITEIQERIKEIKELIDDDEMAHVKEDQLHLDFITSIANSDSPFSDRAKLVLTTSDFNFARWCA